MVRGRWSWFSWSAARAERVFQAELFCDFLGPRVASERLAALEAAADRRQLRFGLRLIYMGTP